MPFWGFETIKIHLQLLILIELYLQSIRQHQHYVASSALKRALASLNSPGLDFGFALFSSKNRKFLNRCTQVNCFLPFLLKLWILLTFG